MDKKTLLILFGFVFLVMLGMSVYSGFTSTGLKAYFSMDVNGNESVNDVAVTVGGTPQSVIGKINNASLMRLGTDYFTYPSSTCNAFGLDEDKNLTIMIPFNVSQGQDSFCNILTCEKDDGNRDILPFQIRLQSNGSIELYINDAVKKLDSIPFSFNNWTVLWLVFNQTGAINNTNITVYVNITYINSTNASALFIRPTDGLGINTAPSQNNLGDGCDNITYDEIHFWNYTFTYDDIVNNYNYFIYTRNFSAPYINQTIINFTDIYNLTNTTINSSFAVISNDSLTIDISLNWFVNNVSVAVINQSVNNNTIYNFELGYGNFSRYNDIFYQLNAISINDSSLRTIQNSSRVNVLNAVPSFANLSFPDNGSILTYLNLTVHNSTDADGDTIYYGFYLNNSLRCWSTDRNCTNLTYNYNGTYNWTAFASDLVSNTSNATMRWFWISAVPIITSVTVTPAAPENAENLVCNWIINDDEQFNCTVKVEWFDTSVLNPHYTASFFVNASDYLVSKATNSTDGNYLANETTVAESIYCRVNVTDAFGLNAVQNATAVTISEDTGGGGGGGGGGSGTVTTIITTAEKIDFQLQSDTGSSSYQFYMNKGDTRTRSVVVINKGDMLKGIKLTCESDNAELCSWINLEKASVDVNTQQNAPVNFDIVVPTTAENGDYTVRLKADYIGTEDYVDVNIIVGSWWGFLLKELVFKPFSDLPAISVYVWVLLAASFIFALILSVILLNIIFKDKSPVRPYIPYVGLFISILVDFIIIAFV